MFRNLLICILFPLGVLAQQEGERFWSGLFTFNTTSNNSFRVNSSGNFNNTNNTNYSGEIRINRGRFLSNDRAFTYGIVGNVNYSESDSYKINGDNRNLVNYQVGAQIGLNKFYSILPGFYATVNNDFSYLYGWNQSNDITMNKTNSHAISYRLSPGLLYRITPHWAFQLNLALLTVNISRNLTSYYSSNLSGSRDTRQNINMNFLSGTTLNNLYFGVLYFPFQTKHKTTQ